MLKGSLLDTSPLDNLVFKMKQINDENWQEKTKSRKIWLGMIEVRVFKYIFRRTSSSSYREKNFYIH